MTEEIKAVIFDMDGVLVDSMKYHVLSFDEALAEIGLDVKKEELYRLEGKGSKLVLEKLFERRGINLGEEVLDELVSRKREMFDKINETEPYPGVKDLLEELKNYFKIGLVSGSNRKNVHEFVSKYFEDIFDEVIAEEDTENKKPSPDPYEKCLEELGLDAEDCLVVENAPLGVMSAKDAGIECWAIATYVDVEDLEQAGADRVYKDHEEFIDSIRDELIGG